MADKRTRMKLCVLRSHRRIPEELQMFPWELTSLQSFSGSNKIWGKQQGVLGGQASVWSKCWVDTLDSMSFSPQNLWGQPGPKCTLLTPAPESPPRAHWPVNLVKLASFRLCSRPCIKNYKVATAVKRTQILYPAPTGQLTTIYYSTSKGSSAFLWPPQSLQTWLHKHSCRHNSINIK